jgi:methanogenic corrinoid protein MtbC1
MSEKLKDLLIDLKEEETIEEVQRLIKTKVNPKEILNSVKEGMIRIGNLWKKKEYFVPEVIYGSEISHQVMKMLKPLVEVGSGNKNNGIVLVGTVKGDIHDIGKNILISLLQAEDFEVHDMGVDLSAERITEYVIKIKPDVLGLSGLLTIALGSMKETVEKIKEKGLRKDLKIIIGGPFLSKTNCEHIGADAFTRNASEGIEIIKNWMADNYEYQN